MNTTLGEPNAVAIGFFLLFVCVTLAITYWAARRTKTTSEYFTAAGNVTAGQNGFALAGDFMSAASFLGIAGLVATSGFDGLIYSVGWLVGWPIITFLIAEPLRNLGKYTFTDVVAYRLRATPVRISAAFGTLTVVSFYLIAQMVGAGNLIRMMFGLSYEAAVVLVGVVMLAYVLFGGMIATTWVQILKAVLLLGGAIILALMVLAKFHFNPLELFREARTQYGDGVLAPGKLVSSPIEAVSLGIALMFGTAGLPRILMRFYTVPDARAARTSVFYATLLIGTFYLVTFVLGAAALSHDLYSHVVKKGKATDGELMRVARIATTVLAVLAIALGIVFKGQNVAFMVGLAFAIAASANFPALLLSMTFRRFTTYGAVASMLTGTLTSLVLIMLSPTVMVDIFHAEAALFPLKNPGVISVPLSIAVGVIVSLLRPEPAAYAGYAEVEQRMHLGARAEPKPIASAPTPPVGNPLPQPAE